MCKYKVIVQLYIQYVLEIFEFMIIPFYLHKAQFGILYMHKSAISLDYH
jgi:hypothetical protein